MHTPRPPDIANPPPRGDPRNIDNLGLWAGSHCWWNNCRQPYYQMHATGDFDLLESMFDLHANQMPSRRAMVSHYYNITGVFWGEYADVFGADQNVGYIAANTNGLDCQTTKRNASWRVRVTQPSEASFLAASLYAREFGFFVVRSSQ